MEDEEGLHQNNNDVIECVKARLLEEGREARNLIAYSLPVQKYKSHSASSANLGENLAKPSSHIKDSKKGNVSSLSLKQEKRPRSASAGRDPQASLRARHWGFLFRNLEQAVGEIYQTCEDDESIIECKEAILMLERYTSDFYKLIDWFKLKWEYENTPPLDRPTSLSWEIRTSSPGKNFQKEKKLPSVNHAKNFLCFDKIPEPHNKKTVNQTSCNSLRSKTNVHDLKESQNPIPKIKSNIANNCNETQLTKDKPVSENSFSLKQEPSISKTIISDHSLTSNNATTETEATESDFQQVNDQGTEKKLIKERNLKDMSPSPEDKLHTILEVSTESSSSENKGSKASPLEETSKDTHLNKPNLINNLQHSQFIPEQLSQNEMIWQHLEGNGCTSCNMVKENEKIVFMDKQKFDHLTPCAEVIEKKTDKTNNNSQSKQEYKSENAKSSSEHSTKSAMHPVVQALSLQSSESHNCVKTPDKATEFSSDLIAKNKSHSTCKVTPVKIQEVDSKKLIENQQQRTLHVKPGPQVNMNKASQVRQAYNQSKTPQKAPCSNNWKITEQKGTVGKPLSTSRIFRRHGDIRMPSSPPSRKRFSGNVRTSGHNIPGHRNTFERSNSSTNFSMPKTLVRAHTTMADSHVFKKNYSSQNKPLSASCGGDQSASVSSLTSSCTTSSSCQSWADKVRGSSVSSDHQPSESHLSLQENDDDNEGWEVVRRGRRSHSGSSASLNSTQAGVFKVSPLSNHKSAPVKFHLKTRYHQPTSAVSMPSLADKPLTQNTPSTEPSTPRQSSLDDASDAVINPATSETLQWSILSQRKRSKSDNLNIPKECKPKRTSDKRKAKIKKQDSGDKSGSLSNELNASNNETFVPMEKHKKNIVNSSKKNEGKKELLNGQDGKPLSSCSSNPPKNNSVSEDNKGESDSTPLSIIKSKDDFDTQNEKNLTATSSNKELTTYSYQHCNIEESLQESSFTPLDDGESSDAEEEKIRSNAAALESATKEEIRLKQQIEETQNGPIEVPDDVEPEDDEEELEEKKSDEDTNQGREPGQDAPLSSPSEDFYNYIPQFKKLSSLSWAEEMDAIENMDSIRHPGRVLHIHEKLSSPSRKLPISEKLRRHQEKLAKAQELRGKLIHAKTEKLKDLFKKINEVNNDKDRLMLEKRKLFERKMERAEEKRKRHLQEIVNKAHDEENKAREIAFINGLEAQNKLHDIMQQHQSHESRLADMAEERSRKQEEKAAKEAAAQERRKALEAERQARMAELCEKRRKRCERIDRRQAERREELLEQAREKDRVREERLSALQQAQQAKESELVKKIQQKQEETARRHEENIEQIRQRALESSIMRYSRECDDAPKLLRYETKKLCTLCSSLIASDVYLLSHLRGKQHQEALKELYKGEVSNEETATYNLKHIVDAPASIDDPQITRDKERQKALKKRYRKIRTRMISRGREYLTGYQLPPIKDTPNKTRMLKSLQQVSKLLSNQGTGPWPSADVNLLDRHLLEISRLLEKKVPSDQLTFAALDGFTKLSSILRLITEAKEGDACIVPARSLGYCAKVLYFACHSSIENCKLLLYSNIVGNAVEQLLRRLMELSAELVRIGSSSSLNTLAALPSDPAAVGLIELISEILNVLKDATKIQGSDILSSEAKEEAEGIWQRLQDVISFCVSIGIVDKTTWYFNHIQYPVENDAASSEFIIAAMKILTSLSNTLIGRTSSGDPTQLVGTIHVTEACGVVSLLYGLLLHQGGRSSSPPPPNMLNNNAPQLTVAATSFLQSLAELDLAMFQSILGSEGISLEVRHISSFLLWYCSHWPCEEVLHNIISLVGFFAVANRENQMVIQSGETPSVLQQLCSLPWQYFSEPRLTSVLFPTLLSCCWENPDNMNILVQEMSFQVLEDFLHKNEARDNTLLQIFQKSVLSTACNQEGS